jgi:hypothetical protein
MPAASAADRIVQSAAMMLESTGCDWELESSNAASAVDVPGSMVGVKSNLSIPDSRRQLTWYFSSCKAYGFLFHRRLQRRWGLANVSPPHDRRRGRSRKSTPVRPVLPSLFQTISNRKSNGSG